MAPQHLPAPRRAAARIALAVALSLSAAACGAAGPRDPGDAGSPSTAASPATASSADPTAVPNPGAPTPGGTTDPATGGGTGGNPGTGVVPVAPGIFPIGGGMDPEPTVVSPVAGARDIRDIAVTRLEAAVEDGELYARASWWSGVEPCTVFAGITFTQDGGTYTITVREGSAAAPDTMCTEQAVFKAAIADLGPAPEGGATIQAAGGGEATPVTVD